MSKQKVQKSVNWSPSSRQKEPSLAPPVTVVQRSPISVSNTDVSIPEYTPLKNNAVENHPLLRQFQIPQLQTSQPIQTKLTIGEVGDKYEQEADRVAKNVVREINAPAIAQREETEEKIARKLIVQRDSIMAEETASQEVESSIHRAKGGGQSLDSSLQNSMGRAMGADFSGVRVHTDSSADRLNQSLQAKAFTTGQDVFFRQGAYQPGSRGGQELIAHELTHVVQQNGRSVQRSPQQQEQLTQSSAINTSFASVEDCTIQAKGDISNNLPNSPVNTIQQTNKEVIQRLIFLRQSNDLLVPNDYFTQSIPQNGKSYPTIAKLPNNKQNNASIKDLYEDNQTKGDLLKFLKSGLMLPDDIYIVSSTKISDKKVSDLNPSNLGIVKDALMNSLNSFRKLLLVNKFQSFYDAGSITSSWQYGLLPSDLLPEADDLTGSVGKNLKKDKDSQQDKWWGYACRLIALVKMERNYNRVKQVTKNNSISNLEEAVQALHDHYYNQNTKVMYDDASSSTSIYPAWGYSLKFSGPCPLEDLPTRRVKLNAGDYIFDIEGHSVKTTIKQNIGPKQNAIATNNLSQYFQFYSDSDNYSGSEETKKVEYIWG